MQHLLLGAKEMTDFFKPRTIALCHARIDSLLANNKSLVADKILQEKNLEIAERKAQMATINETLAKKAYENLSSHYHSLKSLLRMLGRDNK